jgi:hypothetical protein
MGKEGREGGYRKHDYAGQNQSKPRCEKASEDRKKEKEKRHYETTILN